MMKIKWVLLTTCLFLQSGLLMAQNFTIDGPWKLMIEDKKEFSNPTLDDQSWQDLPALTWSDNRNITANRTLWIRKKVVIPSSLRPAFEKTGLLSLSMGKILQADETYLNGKLIGSTGSGDSYRNYTLRQEDILWDAENSIAIRVRHWGAFKMSKVPEIVPALPEHFLSFKSGLKNGDAKAPVGGKALDYQLSVNNQSQKEVAGIVKADFYNFNGNKIFSTQKNVSLASGNNVIDFPYNAPVSFVKVVYTLSLPAYSFTHEWNSEIGYEDVVYNTATPAVQNKAPQKFFPADLANEKIEGWLGEKLKANTEMRLQKVDEDALLAGYMNRPGSHSWIGEHVGKFLDAAVNAYANNGDAALKIQMDRSAQDLIAAQLPDGYLGTYEMDSHWTSWDVWSHKYCIIGLLSYYSLSGFKPALEASKKAGDLLCKTFGYGKSQLDIIKAGAHAGMAATSVLEPMVDLYRYTGDKKYLDFCYYIIKSYEQDNGPKIISTLDATSGRTDKTANAKAYEMLSNFVGIIKLYRLTGDDTFLKPILLAWNDVVKNRLYITGTASSFEHFQADDALPASDKDNMGEGCVTTTWIQLNYQLLCITGEMKYVDELERAAYNHLTGAENPETGAVSYYTPLMGIKPYRSVITCCMSSVPRGIAMIPLFAAGKINGVPSFLFYAPGSYQTTADNNAVVSFATKTTFPQNGNVVVTVDKTVPAAYPLLFRKPYWAAGFAITINGKTQPVNGADAVTIKRVWKKGDAVNINFTMPLIVLNGGKNYPGQIALQRGPQVLALDKSLNEAGVDAIAINPKNLTLQTVSSLPKTWIGSEAFAVKAVQNNSPANIVLVPYADAGQTGGTISTWIKTTPN